MVNIPISETFAARFGYVNESRDDGFYEDVDGDAVDKLAYEAVRVGLRWQPAERWDVTYFYDEMEDEPFDAIFIFRSRVPTLGSEFNTFIDSAHFSTNDVFNHNLLIDVELGGGTLSSVSNYRDRYVYVRTDGDYTSGNPARNRMGAQSVDNQIFFQELRYVADGTDQFNWMIGGDFFKHDNLARSSSWPGVLGLPLDAATWGNASDQTVTHPGPYSAPRNTRLPTCRVPLRARCVMRRMSSAGTCCSGARGLNPSRKPISPSRRRRSPTCLGASPCLTGSATGSAISSRKPWLMPRWRPPTGTVG